MAISQKRSFNNLLYYYSNDIRVISKGVILHYWKPAYQDFQNLFTNEKTLKILVILHKYRNKTASASDIAKILDVHISTAQKYLEILHDYQLVDKKTAAHKPGKPTYYTLTTGELTINLDMAHLSSTLEEDETIPNPVIREKVFSQRKINYILDENNFIREITWIQRAKDGRRVKRGIILSDAEIQFMKYLPHPTMQPEPFLEICEKGQITDYFTVKSLLLFVRKLQELDIIEEYIQE